MTATLSRRPSTWQRTTWRHPEWPVAALAVTAWLALVVQHAAAGLFHGAPHHASAGAGVSVGPAPNLGSWALMIVATMLPTLLPDARTIAVRGKWRRRYRGPALFTAAYVAVWVAFGAALLAVVATVGLAGAPAVAAGLGLAALWELTRWKRLALRACHRVAPLPPDGRKADVAALRAGAGNATRCIAACSPMMMPMALAPHPLGFWLMLLLAGVVAAEKLVVKAVDRLPGFALGLGVLALAVAVGALPA